MSGQADIFIDASALQLRQQFRMRRLQVFNWGTFSNLHDIAVSEDGFLFVGRSGSGKSTLLDALAALLVPPQWLMFNAAAREGERGRRDRNFASYVRGAWGDQKDTDSGEIATRFLRTGTTWSALALTFANGEGRHVSLIQIYWLRGTASANADVRRHYMIAERPFDIATELADFDLEIRGLKHGLHDVDHFGDTFRPYGERFRRLMGIESEMALKLLHKTQSAKNLGDLNTFLREFMLDEPDSFAAADRLVAEFGELDAAHQEVVTARRQVETLRPAREQHERWRALLGQVIDQESLLGGIDGYCDRTRSELLSDKLEELQTRDQGLEGQEQAQQERLDNLKEDLRSLETEHRQKGGDRIEELERKRADAEHQRDTRLKRRGLVEDVCRVLGWAVPDNAHLFSERLGEARSIAEMWRTEQEEADTRRDTLRDQKAVVETEFQAVRREIEAMNSQPSNIPSAMLELRRRIAEELGYAEADLPFVGELIQVKEAAEEWRGAIERVLHGFALSLLVDERRYAAVSNFVNENYLGKRLVYYRVGNERTSEIFQPGMQSLVRKLELKETTYRPWLETELARRFNYACVDNLRDFRSESRALTREGQVRHGPGRHEKDDRSRVDDRRRWVLGFDNREKLTLYMARAGNLGASIAELEEQLKALKEDRAQQQLRYEACIKLTNLEWHEVDVASSLDRIGELKRQLHELREGNRVLQELGERIAQQKEAVDAADQELRNIQVQRQTVGNQLREYCQQHNELSERLEDAIRLDLRLHQALNEKFHQAGAVTLKSLDDRRRAVERAINEELRGLRERQSVCIKDIERAFAEFKRAWPQEGADFDATMETAEEFLAILQRLEYDDLPRHENRFFEMLQEQSTENLAALNARLSQARKEIYARLDTVNEGLADAEFNPNTHLQIDAYDRSLPDVRDFREKAQRILGYSMQLDRENAEDRFLSLRELVQKLGGQETEQRRWREQVLDVRLHVEFIGRELDGEEREVEIYRSGAGKSGGQREKLATTCLAAALRYQLGGSEGGIPLYGPVVLDEAFGKADNEFTELAMRIFEKFGFQMIVATPLKSVMTLEPFIGGACFVDIADRKRSATLPIEYDTQHRKLHLPAHAYGQNTPA